eukprot:Lithocolla_globosa_v1_NODE_1771_length_2348_cov_4.579154.p3 type:complete len:105 gc:universal NODE_1771_length_2348_cov_4.579154:1144-1458(+)
MTTSETATPLLSAAEKSLKEVSAITTVNHSCIPSSPSNPSTCFSVKIGLRTTVGQFPCGVWPQTILLIPCSRSDLETSQGIVFGIEFLSRCLDMTTDGKSEGTT